MSQCERKGCEEESQTAIHPVQLGETKPDKNGDVWVTRTPIGRYKKLCVPHGEEYKEVLEGEGLGHFELTRNNRPNDFDEFVDKKNAEK